MSDDEWLRDALTTTDAAPRPGFQAELRSRLSDEWHGRAVLTPSEQPRSAGRSWWTIGAAAAAVTALVVTGLVWITGDDDSSRIAPPTDSGVVPVTASVPQPAPVTAPVTDPSAPTAPTAPTASTAPATVAGPVTTGGIPLAEWVQAQADAGRTEITFTAGDHTDAQRVTASLDGVPHEEWVLVPDERAVVPAPGGGLGLVGLDGRLVFVGYDDARELAVWVLDATTGEWQPGPPLDIGALGPRENVDVRLAGDVLLVARNRWEARPSDGTFEPVERHGVRVFADLTTVPISEPPDGIAISWTSTAGGKALLMGRDAAADPNSALLSPWAYDPVADTWTEVADPEWLDCPVAGCAWPQPHERGDPSLELETPAGLVQRIPDGTVGLLDPATLTWRRLDDAPFDLAAHRNVVAGDPFIVSVPYGQGVGIEVGTEIGVLTIADGTWRTYDVLPEPLPAMWESKKTPAGLVLQPVGDGVDAWLAVDTTTGEPRLASTSDRAAWHAALAGGTYGTYTPAELLTILAPEAQPAADGPCFAGLDGEAAGFAFAEALVATRYRGATSAPCLDAVPDQFTGTAGACWEECTPRTFPREAIDVDQIAELDDSAFWSISLPVTYLSMPTAWEYVDVIEHWHLRPDGDGWVAALASIESPLPDREASLATANTYLLALAGQDWLAAAELMSGGSADLEERADLQELAPDGYTTEGVAEALARWCADGCDTTAATLDDLAFNGGYALVRNGQSLRITWYEGAYGVYGTPPRPAAPEDGPDLLAGWPDAPTQPVDPLDGIPYLAPTSPVPGADEAVGREWSALPDTASYGQMWVDPVDPTVIVQIDTYPGQSAPRQNTRAVVAPGWDDPRATWSGAGRVNLSLGEPSGYVTVDARGLPEWSVLDLVAGLRRDTSGPGKWEFTGTSLQLVADGWYSGYASRIIHWPDAELIIARAGTALFDTAQQFGATVRLVDLAHGPGVVFESDELVAVAWNVSADVSALFGYRGTTAEALSIVNGLVSTDRAAWLDVAPLDPSPPDGCNGLFC